MNKKAMASILGLCFIFILTAVFLANLFLPDKSFSEEENRVLQENPGFSLSSYMEGRLEKKLENYANDQFLLRKMRKTLHLCFRIKKMDDSFYRFIDQ